MTRSAAAAGFLGPLLASTSRTFALCIPLLPDPLRVEVTAAYLLFRIADSFEDASEWSVDERIAALEAFAAALEARDRSAVERLAGRWSERCPESLGACRDLLASSAAVVSMLDRFDGEAGAMIATHVVRSARGMASFVRRTDGGVLQLDDVRDLRHYCYTVAGIVGEMLTELFISAAPQLASAAPLLRAGAPAFGEGLQLVNIIKDSAADARCGRMYIPRGIERAEVFAIARTDLRSAAEYTLALQERGAPAGVVKFAALPVALARATLDRVESAGPGAKIGRPAVMRIARRIERAVARARPALRIGS